MIPIRTSIEVDEFPGAVFGLIVANVVVFAVQSGLPEDAFRQFIQHNALIPARYTDPEIAAKLGLGRFDLIPFFTSAFMHVDVVHLLVNMWTLWLFGGPLEQRLGAPRLVLFYLLSGAVAGATHFAANVDSAVPALGASGAIAGVFGGFALTYPSARVLILKPILFFPFYWEWPAAVYMGLWFAFQIVFGLAGIAAPGHLAGIAWWAHIGGFAAGLATVRLFGAPPTRPRQIGAARPRVKDVGGQRPLVVRYGARPAPGRRGDLFGDLRNAFSRPSRAARLLVARATRGRRPRPTPAPVPAPAPARRTRRSPIPDSGG